MQKREPDEKWDIGNIVAYESLYRMQREALEEVSNPLWHPPDDMEIHGDPPKIVLASFLVRMKLHMMSHNN